MSAWGSALPPAVPGHSRNRDHVPALDYLPALAALLICLYHGAISLNSWMYFDAKWRLADWPQASGPLAALIVEGHTAVALFMVLSGYVLTAGNHNRPIHYAGFLRNRALRILPLYVLLLLYGSYINPSAFSLAAFVQTVLPLANLPGHLEGQTITGLFWAVAVEAQFYLVFPVLLAAIWRRGRSFILRLLLLTMLLRLAALPLGADVYQMTYFTIFGRLGQFVLGMAAAIHGPRISGLLCNKPMLPLATAGILAMMWAYHAAGGYPQASPWKIFWPEVEGLAWAFFLLCAVYSPYRMPRPVRHLLVAIGTWSYSIYLLHSAVFQIFGVSGWYLKLFSAPYANVALMVALVVPVILAASWLTYTAVEQPFMALRRRYLPEPPAPAAG